MEYVYGCGANKSKDNSNTTTTNTKDEKTNAQKNITTTSKYVDNYDEKYKLEYDLYSIGCPAGAITNSGITADTFKFKVKTGEEVGAMVNLTKVFGDKKANMSLNSIFDKFDDSRSINMSIIYLNSESLTYSGQLSEVKVGKYNTLFNDGKINDADGELCNYASYDFFLDDENAIPCEVMVMSKELGNDDLANIAQEMMATIVETE